MGCSRARTVSPRRSRRWEPGRRRTREARTSSARTPATSLAASEPRPRRTRAGEGRGASPCPGGALSTATVRSRLPAAAAPGQRRRLTAVVDREARVCRVRRRKSRPSPPGGPLSRCTPPACESCEHSIGAGARSRGGCGRRQTSPNGGACGTGGACNGSGHTGTAQCGRRWEVASRR